MKVKKDNKMDIIEITKNKLEIINKTVGYEMSYRRFIVQKETEWIEFDNFLSNKKPFNYCLEIGTHCGGSIIEFMNIAEEDATIITIDKENGHYVSIEDKIKAFNAIKKEHQKIYCVNNFSQYPETIDEVKNILNGNKLDILFIDGDHKYKTITVDFENYLPLVKKGGMIAFHDIFSFGLKKFWGDIKENYVYHEIYDSSEVWGGIGILEI